MATAVRAGEMRGQPVAWPTIEGFEDTVKRARRAVAGARAASEDFVAGASLEVRRHPLTAVGFAASGGLLAGCIVGAAAGWLLARRW